MPRSLTLTAYIVKLLLRVELSDVPRRGVPAQLLPETKVNERSLIAVKTLVLSIRHKSIERKREANPKQ